MRVRVFVRACVFMRDACVLGSTAKSVTVVLRLFPILSLRFACHDCRTQFMNLTPCSLVACILKVLLEVPQETNGRTERHRTSPLYKLVSHAFMCGGFGGCGKYKQCESVCLPVCPSVGVSA